MSINRITTKKELYRMTRRQPVITPNFLGISGQPYRGMEWSVIVCLFLVALIVIAVIWVKIGQGKK